MLKEIVSGVVGAAIIGIPLYMLKIQKMELQIENLKDEASEIKISEVKTKDSLSATKLFIVSRHPDGDISMLSSAKKINDLDTKQLEVLATGVRAYVLQLEFDPRTSFISPERAKMFDALVQSKGITQADMSNYAVAAGIDMASVE